MKAKRTNTNAIKGNKMASMQERKTYKAWTIYRPERREMGGPKTYDCMERRRVREKT